MKKAIFGLAESEAQAVSIFTSSWKLAFPIMIFRLYFQTRTKQGISPTPSIPRRQRARQREPVAVWSSVGL